MFKFIVLSLAVISSSAFASEVAESKEMVNLGQRALYEYMTGTPDGFAKAYQIAKQAKDDDVATRIMANLYYSGKGVNKDLIQAFEYYVAASNNDPESAYMAGFMLMQGEGVDSDLNEAIDYFNQAANMGEPHAQQQLASMYLTQAEVTSDMGLKLSLEKQAFVYAKDCSLTQKDCRLLLANIFEKGLAGIKKSPNAASELRKLAQ